MDEILVSRENALNGDGSYVEVFAKPASFLGDSFPKYLSVMRDLSEEVYEKYADYRLKFYGDTKSYRVKFVARDDASQVMEFITSRIWAGGFACVSERAKQEASERVALDGVMALFDKAKGKLKFPKIRLATDEGSPVVLSLAGPRSKYNGQVMVTDGGPFGDNVWYGRIDTDGSVYPSRSMSEEVMTLLRDLSSDAAEVTGSYGRKTGSCSFCARHLQDKRSVQVGYGPVCADKFGLPWGE